MTAPDSTRATQTDRSPSPAARPARRWRSRPSTITGTNRHSSTQPAGHLSRSGGGKVRARSPPAASRRSRTGGLPSHDVPALDFFGAADSTATRPLFGTERPGAAMPELPRKARLPTFAGRCASSRRPARRTRPWCRRRGTRRRRSWSSGQQQHGRGLDVLADLRAERRSHHGVNRLAYSGKSSVRAESSSRSVAQTCQPIRLRTGWCPGAPRCPSSRTATSVSKASRAREHGRQRDGEQRGGAASPSDGVVVHSGPIKREAGERGQQRCNADADAVADASHPPRRPRGPLVRPGVPRLARRAGGGAGPALAGGTVPTTAEPAAISAPRPTRRRAGGCCGSRPRRPPRS